MNFKNNQEDLEKFQNQNLKKSLKDIFFTSIKTITKTNKQANNQVRIIFFSNKIFRMVVYKKVKMMNWFFLS